MWSLANELGVKVQSFCFDYHYRRHIRFVYLFTYNYDPGFKCPNFHWCLKKPTKHYRIFLFLKYSIKNCTFLSSFHHIVFRMPPCFIPCWCIFNSNRSHPQERSDFQRSSTLESFPKWALKRIFTPMTKMWQTIFPYDLSSQIHKIPIYEWSIAH